MAIRRNPLQDTAEAVNRAIAAENGAARCASDDFDALPDLPSASDMPTIDLTSAPQIDEVELIRHSPALIPASEAIREDAPPTPAFPSSLPALPSTIDPALAAILANQQMMLERMMAVVMQGSNNPMFAETMARMTEALSQLGQTNIESAKLMAAEQRRIHRPSNEVVPFRSTLNPRGERDYPKPRLKCPMHIPWAVDADSCTREEIELLNLLQPGEYVYTRVDNMKIRVTVKMDFDVTGKKASKLTLVNDQAFNNDNHRWNPPLASMLRQVLRQHEDPYASASKAVMSMDEEEELIAAEKLEVAV